LSPSPPHCNSSGVVSWGIIRDGEYVPCQGRSSRRRRYRRRYAYCLSTVVLLLSRYVVVDLLFRGVAKLLCGLRDSLAILFWV
jgi:hypothetical protein